MHPRVCQFLAFCHIPVQGTAVELSNGSMDPDKAVEYRVNGLCIIFVEMKMTLVGFFYYPPIKALQSRFHCFETPGENQETR